MISFGNGILSMRSTVLAKVSAILLAIYTLIMSYRVRLLTAGKALMTQLAIGIQTMNSLVRARSNEIGNTIYNTTMSFRGRMQSAGQSLISSLATGIRNSTGQVSSAMRSVSGAMLNAISKGINGSISGVNHVLGQLGSSKKISSWTIPAYKQGTTGHPEDGPAIVNDGSGPYQEAYITPEGKMGLFPRIKNLLVPMMRRGTQIIKGSTVAKMKKHIPAYAEGTDDFDIYDYLDKPKELLEKATAMKTNLSGVVEPWLNMTKSAMALIVTEALPMIEEEIANLMPTGAGSRGEFIRLVLAQEGKQYVWGAEGPNTFDCSGLIMWALGQIGIPFPHYTGAQWNATEHITEKEAVAGDLIYFGNGASRHVGMYTKPGQMFHASSPNAFGPGNGIGYGSYAASDLWGFARIRELAASVSNVASLAGGAVNRWVPYIKKAAAVMKVKLTNADMQAILAQIQLESGGNEKIRQQIYDVNSYNGSGGAKGLLQFIDSTFLNYAMPGHKNIFSGYDQLLAMFNIPNYRRFVRGISGWSPYGARRFENGGWITKDGLYRAGENDNPEIVLPLTKPRRAIDLIIQALSYINGGGLSGSVSSGLSALSEGLDATLANMKSLAIGSLVATSEIIVQTASGTALGANEYASIDSGSIIQAIYDLAETIQKMKVEMDGREVGKIVAPVVKSTNERNENFRKHLRGE